MDKPLFNILPGLAALASALYLSLAPIQMDAAPKKAAPAAAAAQKKTIDSPLEARIESRIKSLKKEGKLSPYDRTAFSVYYFNDDKKLVSINEEVPMQSASMIKPLVALAYFHQMQHGKGKEKLSYDKKTKNLMEAMIRKSNNYATNALIRKIGGPAAVQQILKRNYGNILRQTSIVQEIPRGGKEYKNQASARDYSRFLYALWNERLPYHEELSRIMGLKKRNRISTEVAIPNPLEVYSKTGTTGHLCGDMGIIVAQDSKGKEHVYTVIGILERKNKAENYKGWMRGCGKILRDISGETFRYIEKTYR